MKKITQIISLVFASLLLLTACSENPEPQLNTHYSQLPNDISDLVQQPVVEVFSLTCGHCLQMEKFIPEIEEGIGQPVGKVHVTFNERAQAAALFYYAAAMQSETGKPDEGMMTALFNANNTNSELPANERKQLLVDAFNERGLVSPYDLNEEQKQQLFEEVTKAVDITGKGLINSVPTFVVNGKYMVITSAHNDLPSIVNTIKYLIAKG
ncbi:thioredoxin domain-containing protein [Vibrio breoganii]|uniref:thioredoxin domain-containing protein n=1 Tax=Vibrio breoganii TaxID=553239 RepID=UPI000C819128|nr:thioredoxin domain-containing protein [Vibrio breoganii]PML39798.1 thiol-disulfide isomerase [Vibrio breoganii]PMO80575.1 thiol-disulfide isomerase [Vibrio breoganii]PMO86268.1 thiol-disulfide isomerase [Vibrio breoganii]